MNLIRTCHFAISKVFIKFDIAARNSFKNKMFILTTFININ